MTTRATGVIEVVIADDQPLLVSAFSALVATQPNTEAVLEAANGCQAVESLTARATGPHGGADLMLMNPRMSVLDGISAIRRLRVTPATAALRVLVLTAPDDEDLVLAVLDAGAHGFLLKDAEPTMLLEAIRVIVGGGLWLDPAATGTALAYLDVGTGSGAPLSLAPLPVSPSVPTDGVMPVVRAPSDPYEALTGREDAIPALVCQGLSNASIGERLHVAESTVRSYVKTILGKTDCYDRAELATYALTTGLVQPR